MQYKVKWQRCPHISHEGRTTLVEAPSVAAAREVIEDYILRTYQTDWFTIWGITEYLAPAPSAGKVIV
jgi:hypothetical protein